MDLITISFDPGEHHIYIAVIVKPETQEHRSQDIEREKD